MEFTNLKKTTQQRMSLQEKNKEKGALGCFLRDLGLIM